MHFIDKIDCTGCSACYAVCPQKCIHMKKDEESFYYPEVDKEQCISCNRCSEVCPVINKTASSDGAKKEEAYIVCHKEQDIRLDSASGGAFTVFAQYVLKKEGIVCGAGYDSGLNVVHKICDKFSELEGFRGSKYVQSEMRDIHGVIKQYLNKGRYVLFTGTPCQVEGLLRYLGREYERLITVDIACHGVPSPLLWEKYIKDGERKSKKKVLYIKCRDKSRGWRNWGMVTKYDDGYKTDQAYYEDPFMEVYLSHNAMRYSCYRCKFRNIFNKESDATMADCWGIENFAPKMDDDMGASILFLHTEKIKKLWSEISSCANVKKVNPYRALQGNIGAWGGGLGFPRHADVYMRISLKWIALKR